MTALTFMNASVLMAVVNYSFFDRLFLGDFPGDFLGLFGDFLGTFGDCWRTVGDFWGLLGTFLGASGGFWELLESSIQTRAGPSDVHTSERFH